MTGMNTKDELEMVVKSSASLTLKTMIQLTIAALKYNNKTIIFRFQSPVFFASKYIIFFIFEDCDRDYMKQE